MSGGSRYQGEINGGSRCQREMSRGSKYQVEMSGGSRYQGQGQKVQEKRILGNVRKREPQSKLIKMSNQIGNKRKIHPPKFVMTFSKIDIKRYSETQKTGFFSFEYFLMTGSF